jgi:predicted N-formylglutamate amidohydrolase
MQDGSGSGDAAASLVEETFEIVPGGLPPGRTRAPAPGLILLCDHAGNAFPPGYGTLGLPQAELRRHIAYDIGAAGVVRAMAARLGAVAVLSRYSRLLIDLNRGADDPTLIMRLSDGAVVPGNHPIDETEWNKRIRLYYDPYHAAVDSVIARMHRQGITPVIVSLHSYTQAWKGVARPWQVGILWDRDDRIPARLIDALRADLSLEVGDNQPYSGQLEGDCLYRHATSHGFAHALVEVRQDLIADAAGQQAWADRLSTTLESLWTEPGFAALVQPIPPLRLSPHVPLHPGLAAPHMTEQTVPQRRTASATG